jgi:protein required for attachment to host cells
MHAQRTLIVVAAEGGARFLSAVAHRPLRELPMLTPDESGRDAAEPGRGRDGSGAGQHSYEPRTSARRLRREDFAGQVLEAAATIYESEEYDRVILVAPPKMLGALRDELPEPMARNVIAEIDADLLKVPLDEVGRHLRGHLPV